MNAGPLEEPAELARAGLARLERFAQTHQPDELDRGIDTLEASVWALPRGEPLVEHAIGQLAFAYLDRAERRGHDRASVTSAIAVAQRALATTAEGADRDTPHSVIASAYQCLWSDFGDRADLDAAVDSWRVVATDDDWISSSVLAELLISRSALDQNVTDADGAIALLDRMLNVDSQDRPDLDLTRQLAVACRTRFALSPNRSALEHALAFLDRVEPLATDADQRVEWFLDVLETAYLAAKHDDALPHTNVPASVVRLVAIIEQGHGLLSPTTPADPTLRAVLAGGLVVGELIAAGGSLRVPDLDRLDVTIDLASTLKDAPSGWLSDLRLVREVIWHARAVAGQASRVDIRLDAVLGVFNRDSSGTARDVAGALLAVMAQARATSTQSRTGRDEAAALMALSADTDLALYSRLMRLAASFQPGATYTDTDESSGLWAAIEAAPPSPTVAHVIRPVAAFLLRMLGSTDVPADVVAPAAVPGMDPQLRSLVEWSAMAARYNEVVRRDRVDDLRAYAVKLRRFARQVGPDQLLARLGVTWLVGRVSLDIARRDPFDRAAAVTAAEWFDEAISLARGEHHPQWSQLAMGLAEAIRRSEVDHARSLSLGLSALSAQARVVMLQNSTEQALAAARRGAKDADAIVTWALRDGDGASAVAALDASRGLVLQAISASRAVADRLDAAGRHDLAVEWRATAGRGRDELTGQALVDGSADGEVRLSDALRARVLAVLDGAAAMDDPPSVLIGRIQVGLGAANADALVYLLPETDSRPGQAVIVPRVGRATTLVVPGLTFEGNPRLSGYVKGARDVGVATPSAPKLADHLLAVGDWAGSVVLAPLIAHLGRAHDGRPAHVVLVPMGELALVPWHAAFTERDGRRRYVVEDLIFSYSPSARLFCAAARYPVPAIGAVLIVGDPDGTLRFAGHEAQAIHRALHPRGRYLGAGGPTATPQAVLDWITTTRGESSLLHFACHGTADATAPDRAGLVLAGGTLSARDLIEAARLAELVVDQVFLAACHTNTLGGEYDEAFSLASVFLAAGAHTVFGSLWAVPDEATSLLMFMAHHFLTADRRPPARALHAAQRWMLDPNRRPPDSMPAALARYAGQPELAEPVAWAAFTHLGR